MPGVLNSNSKFGFSREVGKMANVTDLSLMDFVDPCLEDIANKIFSGASEFIDSDADAELPDNEITMDLLKFLDSNDDDDGSLLNVGSPTSCSGRYSDPLDVIDPYDKYRVSARQDPFMGMSNQESNSPTAKNSLLSQMMSPLDYDYDQSQQQQKNNAPSFVAWGHRSHPIKTEKDDYGDDLEELTKSSISHLVSSTYQEDDDMDSNLPICFMDTPSPSSQSGTATGDDSDVDIETITEAPQVADSGYASLECSSSSRASSPVSGLRCHNSGSLLSMLAKSPISSAGPSSPSSTNSSACSSPRRSPAVHFSTYGVSSSASLAENLMKGRSSLLGQKRKLAKEKRAQQQHRHHQLERRISSSSPSPQHSYTHVLCTCTSNSINFHDYAMSPLSPESSPPSFSPTPSLMETGLPTVTQSKRIYKRKQLPLDASGKEKQHHHNQLERNRRQKLADLFVDLRDEVPSITCQSKASKVMILKEATDYIRDLQTLESSQQEELSSERRRKEALTRQLHQLRAQLDGGRIG